jgi:hypothetical protein
VKLSTDLSWLKAHCLLDEERPAKLDPIKSLWSLDGWVGACDTRALIAVRGEVEKFPALSEVLAGPIRPLLASKPTKGAKRVTVSALREWCGLEPATPCKRCADTLLVECWRCDARGKRERDCEHCGRPHECDCDDCLGSGKSPCKSHGPDPHYGVLGGVRINRRVLGRALDLAFAGETLKVMEHGNVENHSRCLILHGDEFLVVVMACVGDEPAEPFRG